MLEELSQETVTEYANEALTIQEPQGTDYTQGVKVGKTIPAKWWNWLFNAVTKRLGQSKTDAQGILSELQNTVTDAGIELDSSDNTQLSQAVAAKTDTQINNFIDKKRWYYNYWKKCYQEDIPNFRNMSNAACDVLSTPFGAALIKYNPNGTYENWSVQSCSVCFDGYNFHELPLSYPISGTISRQSGFTVTPIKFASKYLAFCTEYTIEGVSTRNYLCTSYDMINWSTVEAPFGASFNGARFFIADGILYALVCKYPSSALATYLYYTTDGLNWTQSSATNLSPGVRFSSSAFIDTFKFRDGYLVYNVLLNTATKTITTLTEDQHLSVLYDYYFTLDNGIAFIGYNHSGSTFYRCYPDGASEQITTSSLAGWSVSSDNRILFKHRTDNGVNYVDFSTDGTNIFSSLEVSIPEGLECVFVPANGFYYIDNKRTSDFVTWETLSNLPSGTYVTQTVYANIITASTYRSTGTISIDYVSYDYGNSWTPIEPEQYTHDGAQVNVKIPAKVPIIKTGSIYFKAFVYADAHLNHTFLVYSISQVTNRVIGYTLYLG